MTVYGDPNCDHEWSGPGDGATCVKCSMAYVAPLTDGERAALRSWAMAIGREQRNLVLRSLATPSSVTPDLRAALSQINDAIKDYAPDLGSTNRTFLMERITLVLASVTPSEPTPSAVIDIEKIAAAMADPLIGPMVDQMLGRSPSEQTLDAAYELWDSETANIIGAYPTLNALVAAAYGLGQANPDEPESLSVVDSRQIAASLRGRPA